MNALVYTGAFKQVTGGWTLDDTKAAQDIASSLGVTIVQGPKTTTTQTTRTKTRAPSNTSSTVKQITPGNRQRITIAPSSISNGDPVKRALLLERANNIHEQLVSEVAQLLMDCGEIPLEDVNSFDVAITGANEVLIEVKTITASNCISQLRKAIAQLPEYRWRHKSKFSSDVKQIIVLSESPIPFLNDDYLDYIIDDRGLHVVWKHDNDFIDSTGRSLKEILFPSS